MTRRYPFRSVLVRSDGSERQVVWRHETDAPAGIDFSARGGKLVLGANVEDNPELLAVDLDTRRIRNLTRSERWEFQPAWRPKP